MVGILGDLVGVLGVLVAILGVLVGIFYAFIGVCGVLVGEFGVLVGILGVFWDSVSGIYVFWIDFASKQSLWCSLWIKVRWFEKSMPTCYWRY